MIFSQQFHRAQLLLRGSGQGLPNTNPSLMLAVPNSMKWSPKASGRITSKGPFRANVQKLMMILNLAQRNFFLRLELILTRNVLFPVCRCDQSPRRHASLRPRQRLTSHMVALAELGAGAMVCVVVLNVDEWHPCKRCVECRPVWGTGQLLTQRLLLLMAVINHCYWIRAIQLAPMGKIILSCRRVSFFWNCWSCFISAFSRFWFWCLRVVLGDLSAHFAIPRIEIFSENPLQFKKHWKLFYGLNSNCLPATWVMALAQVPVHWPWWFLEVMSNRNNIYLILNKIAL